MDVVRYSAANELRKLGLSTRAAPDTTIEVTAAAPGRPAVSLRLTRSSKTQKATDSAPKASAGQVTVTTSIHLTARGAGATAAVDAFVNDSFRHHADRLKRSEDAAGRFMFTPQPDSDKSWKRYKLSGPRRRPRSGRVDAAATGRH